MKTLCLGVLSLGDASGYEIKKVFEGPFAVFYKAGFGSIYPALGALLADGLATCSVMEQESRPAKKVYTITPQGIKALKASLAVAPAPDKIQSEAMVMFFFADLMEAENLRDVYEKRVAGYRAKAEYARSMGSKGVKPCRLFTRGFGLALYEAAIRYMEENKDLLLAGKTKN